MIYRGLNWNDFDQRITANFTVGEVSHRDARRMVSDPRIADNAIALAAELQKARNFIGRPLIVTSWYRPPDVNRAEGGATNSQHLTANAADLYCPSLEFGKLLALFRANWTGYLFSYPRSGFLHADRRNGGGWQTGGSPAYYEQLE